MVLFVNACVRGDKSRTGLLCQSYLKGLKERGLVVREVDLGQMNLMPLSAQKVAFRSQLVRAGLLDDSIFALAHQFADAEEIVIGAPYWDLAFPAVLKIYFEHVSADKVTFRFTPEGRCEGLCVARHITYLTTSGGFLTEEPGNAQDIGSLAHPRRGLNLGYDYVCALAAMFGIPDVRYVAAEGLDVQSVDASRQLEAAQERARRLIEADMARSDEIGG